jgi:hypothetical protein
VKGSYTFKDGLQYNDEQWKYCTKKERRFYSETIEGIKPSGHTNMSANGKEVPKGCYDAGDGYYDPEKKVICSFDDGSVLRTPNSRDAEIIMSKSRVSV